MSAGDLAEDGLGHPLGLLVRRMLSYLPIGDVRSITERVLRVHDPDEEAIIELVRESWRHDRMVTHLLLLVRCIPRLRHLHLFDVLRTLINERLIPYAFAKQALEEWFDRVGPTMARQWGGWENEWAGGFTFAEAIPRAMERSRSHGTRDACRYAGRAIAGIIAVRAHEEHRNVPNALWMTSVSYLDRRLLVDRVLDYFFVLGDSPRTRAAMAERLLANNTAELNTSDSMRVELAPLAGALVGIDTMSPSYHLVRPGPGMGRDAESVVRPYRYQQFVTHLATWVNGVFDDEMETAGLKYGFRQTEFSYRRHIGEMSINDAVFMARMVPDVFGVVRDQDATVEPSVVVERQSLLRLEMNPGPEELGSWRAGGRKTRASIDENLPLCPYVVARLVNAGDQDRAFVSVRAGVLYESEELAQYAGWIAGGPTSLTIHHPASIFVEIDSSSNPIRDPYSDDVGGAIALPLYGPDGVDFESLGEYGLGLGGRLRYRELAAAEISISQIAPIAFC